MLCTHRLRMVHMIIYLHDAEEVSVLDTFLVFSFFLVVESKKLIIIRIHLVHLELGL